MKLKYFLFAFIFFQFFIIKPSRATHYVGSDFYYDFKGFASNGSAILELHLYLYRDGHAANLNTINSLELAVYNDDANKSFYRTKILKSKYLNQLVVMKNSKHCYLDPGIEVLEDYFVDTIILPNNNFGYHIIYTDCCRHFEDNIKAQLGNNGPGQSETPGLGYYLYYASKGQINSSARFSRDQTLFICRNEKTDLLFSSTDPDADSLVYSLVQPYDSIKFFKSTYPNNLSLPLNGIPYETGYGSQNIFGSGGINQINTTNGSCVFKPPNNGNYAYAIEIQEYRNGIKISSVRKDLLLYVLDCPLDFSVGPTGCSPNILIPDAFSPNGDGFNDNFKVESSQIEIFNIQIFSRWGEMVFKSEDQKFNWDGKFNNSNLNAGVFAVIINARGSDGKIFNMKALVHLVK